MGKLPGMSEPSVSSITIYNSRRESAGVAAFARGERSRYEYDFTAVPNGRWTLGLRKLCPLIKNGLFRHAWSMGR